MLIRFASTEDAAAIAALVERYWEFESIEGFDSLRVATLLTQLISEPQRGTCWVAEANGRFCGYLLAVFVFSLEHGGLMAEIDEVFVSEEFRSAGLGSLLVTRAERDLAERGMVRLQLQLGVHNETARRFYQRHGFLRRADYELFDKPL
jgi:GNAT superfamily N-acetyltransferase